MSEQERRRFFRIKDDVYLTCTKISEQQYAKAQQSLKSSQQSAFSLSADFANLNNEIHPVLNNIKQTQPDIAQYLELLNTKIDALGQHLLESEAHLKSKQSTRVNLSASGIAFESTQHFENEQALALEIILIPERVGIMIYGRAFNKQNPNTNIALTCVDFEFIRDADQELIIKHNLNHEMKILRQRADLD